MPQGDEIPRLPACFDLVLLWGILSPEMQDSDKPT